MSILNYYIFQCVTFLCDSFFERTYWNISFVPLLSLTTPTPNICHQLIRLSAENRYFVCDNLMGRWPQINKNQSKKTLSHPEAVWFWSPIFLSIYCINIFERKFVSINQDHGAYGSKTESILGNPVLARACWSLVLTICMCWHFSQFLVQYISNNSLMSVK